MPIDKATQEWAQRLFQALDVYLRTMGYGVDRAHPRKVFFDEHGLDRFQRDNVMRSEGRMTGDLTVYARLFHAGIEEADPRTLPPPRQWSNAKYEAWRAEYEAEQRNEFRTSKVLPSSEVHKPQSLLSFVQMVELIQSQKITDDDQLKLIQSLSILLLKRIEAMLESTPQQRQRLYNLCNRLFVDLATQLMVLSDEDEAVRENNIRFNHGKGW